MLYFFDGRWVIKIFFEKILVSGFVLQSLTDFFSYFNNFVLIVFSVIHKGVGERERGREGGRERFTQGMWTNKILLPVYKEISSNSSKQYYKKFIHTDRKCLRRCLYQLYLFPYSFLLLEMASIIIFCLNGYHTI